MQQTLYISHSKRGKEHFYLDASARYRCIFPCTDISDSIIKHCVHFKQLKHIRVSDYSTVIFHRPVYSNKLKRLIQHLENQGINVIADFDDLLFSVEHALESPAYLSGQLSKQQALDMTQNYLKALNLFSKAQVSTEPLKQYIEQCSPKIRAHVINNRIPAYWSYLSTEHQAHPIEKQKDKVIRYFPGTSHHSANFNSVNICLNKILNNNSDIRLEVVGDINIPNDAFPKAQFKQTETVLFDELPALISSSWLTISPLENNTFNLCKSGLKAWESGIFGVPVISSSNPDMERLKCSGLSLTTNISEWEHLILNYKDANNYAASSKAIRQSSAQSVIASNTFKAANSVQLVQILSSNYGPNWLECLYNPTHKLHLKINEQLSQLSQLDNQALITSIDDNITSLNSKFKFHLKNYFEQSSKVRIKRKLLKLKNNPRLFVKDMLKNI